MEFLKPSVVFLVYRLNISKTCCSEPSYISRIVYSMTNPRTLAISAEFKPVENSFVSAALCSHLLERVLVFGSLACTDPIKGTFENLVGET